MVPQHNFTPKHKPLYLFTLVILIAPVVPKMMFKALLLLQALLACVSYVNAGYFSRFRYFRDDRWLRRYDTIRVVTSDWNYLPVYLAANGKKYGEVNGQSTLKIMANSYGREPYAMSASGMVTMENPPTEFLQGSRRFATHLHEGTCDELNKQGKITNGLGNHYQHIPDCLTYSAKPAAGSLGYADTVGCRNSEAPGGMSRGSKVFEMWPTYFGVPGDNNTFKVGSLSEEADDLVECPVKCERYCTDCHSRNVPWWPVPGTAVSIAVHDTSVVESGAGPIMLCAEITGLAVEQKACEAAGIEDCRETPEEEKKMNSYCLYSINPFLSAGSDSPCQ